MVNFITRRTARALLTLLVFQTILFLLIQALPWDYGNLVRGPLALRQLARARLGLDLPLWQQFYRWVGGFFTGDLGVSYRFNAPVTGMLLNLAPRTLLLFLPGTLAGFGLGLWLGRSIAWRRGGWLEFGATVGGIAFYTSFAPWLAFTLVSIFALYLRWLPAENLVNFNVWLGSLVPVERVVGWLLWSFLLNLAWVLAVWWATRRTRHYRRWIRLTATTLAIILTAGLWVRSGWSHLALDILDHLVLPLSTLVLLTFGETMLLMRATMIEVLGDDHVRTARAKGVVESGVRDRHVARLALLPVLARFIMQLPLVLIGSFVIERVFFWRGVGQALFEAADYYDLPVLMGILSIVGVTMLLAHLVLDILTVWLDPRLRTGGMLQGAE